MEQVALTPSPTELRLKHLSVAPDRITVVATTRRRFARCPACGQASVRVHSYYGRCLADLPWHGVPVTVELHTRRFFCKTLGCKRRIFTERIPETAAP